MMDNQSPTIPGDRPSHTKLVRNVQGLFLVSKKRRKSKEDGRISFGDNLILNPTLPCPQATCMGAGPRGTRGRVRTRSGKQPAKSCSSSFLQQLSRRWDELAPPPGPLNYRRKPVSLGSCSSVSGPLPSLPPCLFLLPAFIPYLSSLIYCQLYQPHIAKFCHRHQGLFPSLSVYSANTTVDCGGGSNRR